MKYLEPEVGTFQIRGRLVRGTLDAGSEHQLERRGGGVRGDRALPDQPRARRSTPEANASRQHRVALS
jgi:hypothetical protein